MTQQAQQKKSSVDPPIKHARWPWYLKLLCGILGEYHDVRRARFARCSIRAIHHLNYDEVPYWLDLTAKHERLRNKWYQRGGYDVPPV